MPADPSLISLPTVIWSGIVAALISLGGVILSNRSSLERLKEQLRHDAREKYRDRLANLRKDVYLALVAETTKANAYLGSLAGRDPTDGAFGEPLQGAMAELAKVQLIGSREAAATAGELSARYAEVLLNLIGAAKPMYDAKSDIKIADNLYQQAFAQSQRVLAEIATENESGAPRKERMDSLFSAFDHYRDQYCSIAAERDAAWERFNSQHKDFIHAVLGETKRLGEAQILLARALRDETGLDTDESDLRRRLEENNKRASQAIDSLLDKLKLPDDE